MDLLFTLRIDRLNHSQIFYQFGFPKSSYYCVFLSSAALHDIILLFIGIVLGTHEISSAYNSIAIRY